MLLWASLMDSMPFMPTNSNLPLADADDQAYAESGFRKTKSGRIVERDNSCSGVAKRLAIKRGRWCRRLFCNPREHGGTVGGNYVWTDTVEVKQAEVQTRLWRWILDKEDTRYGVRRTAPWFWKLSDDINASYRASFPAEAGLFDLNRYQNR